MNDRKLIRRVLDALEEVNQWRRTGIGRPPEQTSMDVVDALRERLAQPDQQVCQNSELAPDRKLPAQQEPVGEVVLFGGDHKEVSWSKGKLPSVGTKLYDHPQARKPTVDDDSQDWRGMDGAIAWHLIDRHADGWSDVGKMMNEWLEANQTQPAQPQQEPVAYRSRWRNTEGQIITGWVAHTETTANPDPRLEIEPLYTSPLASKPLTDELLSATQMAIQCSFKDHGRRSVNEQAWQRMIQAIATHIHGIKENT